MAETESDKKIDAIEQARQQYEAVMGADTEIKYEEGFTWKTIVGALFVAFIMLPGSMYLGLVAGQSLGSAAEWVTIVLFSEVARRSFIPLKRQEIYILYYVAGSLAMSGGPFGGLIWNQYLIQSPQLTKLVSEIPGWVVPRPDSPALLHRTFLHPDWTIPILLVIITSVLGRLNWIGMGYFLFRMTSDVERLPFPMAPIAASGATALAEAGTKEESWRWRVFSTGTMIGLVFGTIYVFIPVFTGMFLSKPVLLIPIPFIDFVPNTENILPAALTGLVGDLGTILVGFVLPFPIVAGSFCGSVLCQIIVNPILYHIGRQPDGTNTIFPDWRHGMGTLHSQIVLGIDFWMSVGAGIALAIAFIGLYNVVKQLRQARGTGDRQRLRSSIPAGRGDFPISLALTMWLFATIGYIAICAIVLKGDPSKGIKAFPIWMVLFFGLVWTPMFSYINARLIGLTGTGVGIPYMHQTAVLLSHYQRADVWFAPIPWNDLGGAAQRFREVELTGTKFTSVIKAEIVTFVIIMVASFGFWAFFWHTSPIPSPQFPWAQKMWPINATNQSIWLTANKPGGANWLLKALKFNIIGYSFGIGLVLYTVMSALKLPIMFFYGFAGGMTALPHGAIPTFGGALLGRYYMSKRFGTANWRKYAPVLLAGYSCGVGLIGMAGIALALIAKSVNYLPF